MRIRKFAHLSDLHICLRHRSAERVLNLLEHLESAGVDHLVISGDITHRGRRAELQLFYELFGPYLRQRRLTVVPGNHDRNGDGVAAVLMPGARVQVDRAEGLYLVRVDSTAANNHSVIDGRGIITHQDITDILAALDDAPRHVLPVLIMHHHPLPLPDDHLHERITSWLGLSYTSELALGAELLERLRGRCQLILHGHRHRPSEQELFGDSERPLALFNAGHSPSIGAARIFCHCAGELVSAPCWVGERPLALPPRQAGPDVCLSHPAGC
jgi:3',5'-cyclic AMP phosphodiesterase CpdA